MIRQTIMDKMPGEVRPAGETPVAPGAPSVSPAPIILGMYDLGEYQVYEMIGAKLAAAFDVFVKLSLPEGPGREPPAQRIPNSSRRGTDSGHRARWSPSTGSAPGSCSWGNIEKVPECSGVNLVFGPVDSCYPQVSNKEKGGQRLFR